MRSAARRAAALASTLMLAGCSMLHRGPSPDAPLGASPSDTTAANSSAATPDSTTVAADTAPPKTTSASTPPKTSSNSEPATPTEPKISAQQEVGVGLDATTKAGLAAQTRKDLDEAERLVRTLAAGELSTDRREKVATVDSLITSARAAFDADIEAAAALAHKARLLAEEIGRS